MIDLQGWSRDQVLDQIDSFFLKKLGEEWQEFPPLRIIVGLFAGIKPREKPNKNFAELLAMFPSGRIN